MHKVLSGDQKHSPLLLLYILLCPPRAMMFRVCRGRRCTEAVQCGDWSRQLQIRCLGSPNYRVATLF